MFVYVTALILLLNFIQIEKSIDVPAVVSYEDETVVKTPASGTLAQLYITPGTFVHKDQPLFRLENSELMLNMQLAELTVRKIDLEARSHLLSGEISRLQALEKMRDAKQEKLTALQEQTRELIVRTSAKGLLLARHPERLLGTNLKKGQTLLRIVSDGEKNS